MLLEFFFSVKNDSEKKDVAVDFLLLGILHVF